MSFYRRAKKVDASQGPIVAALRAAGISVWIIGTPCDLLTYNPATQRWKPLECKPTDPHNRHRRDQGRQKEFVSTYAIPLVRTAEEALQAVKQGAADES
jgi:hypothetical protein